MEYYGYHVFNDDYKQLTEDQALFIDFGLTKLHNDMNSLSDKENKELSRLKRKSNHIKHF